jgi:hypothetical protein
MRLRSVPILGLLLALALGLIPALAGPAHAATVALDGTVTGLDASGTSVAVAGVYVEASGSDGAPLDPRVYAYTGANGAYQLTLPQTGSYRIDIACPSGAACAQDYAPEPTVVRSFSAPTTLDATLDRWGRITGTVKRNGVATGWPNGRISASNDARDYWSSEYPGVTVDANGRFTIDKVAPGTVAVTGSEPYGTDAALSAIDGQTFAVAPGATSDITLAVEDWPGLYVRAVDPAGAPLAGLRWNVFSRPVGGTWDAGLQMGPLTTGDDGRMSHRITDKTREYTVCFYDDYSSAPPAERRLTRCLGNSPDLAGATVWRYSAGQPKLKQDVALPLPFTATPAPTISGTAKVGSTLTASAGAWAPAPTMTTYEWFRSGVATPVATGTTYPLVAADAGHTLTVRVTGQKTGYQTTSKTSAATATVTEGAFTAAPAPTISGTAKVGSTLTANAGAWAPAPTTTTYEWFRSGVATPVATGTTYPVVAADAGQTLTVRMTGARAGYATTSATSGPTSAVALGAFTTVPTPTVSGTAQVGSTLTAEPGTWSPAATTTTYQWLRGADEVPGATGRTYVLTELDAGATVTVRVTGARDGYAAVSATSVASAQVADGGFSMIPTPTISGAARVDATLTANAGTWVPAATTTSYQWLRRGVAIAGATGASYRPTAADVGAPLAVRVTAARDGYTPSTVTSNATAPVALAAFAQAPAPRIKGKGKVGAKLTAVVGAWSPAPVTTRYQWYRNGKRIKGATKASYKAVRGDRGRRITVVVTRTRPGYASLSRTSAALRVR